MVFHWPAVATELCLVMGTQLWQAVSNVVHEQSAECWPDNASLCGRTVRASGAAEKSFMDSSKLFFVLILCWLLGALQT